MLLTKIENAQKSIILTNSKTETINNIVEHFGYDKTNLFVPKLLKENELNKLKLKINVSILKVSDFSIQPDSIGFVNIFYEIYNFTYKEIEVVKTIIENKNNKTILILKSMKELNDLVSIDLFKAINFDIIGRGATSLYQTNIHTK